MLEYRLTPEQSEAWGLTEAFRMTVEESIAETIQEADCHEDVVVTLDDGSILYMLECHRA